MRPRRRRSWERRRCRGRRTGARRDGLSDPRGQATTRVTRASGYVSGVRTGEFRREARAVHDRRDHGPVDLRLAWDTHAEKWARWARTPGHDSYEHFHRD